jgi:hypothetical protein
MASLSERAIAFINRNIDSSTYLSWVSLLTLDSDTSHKIIEAMAQGVLLPDEILGLNPLTNKTALRALELVVVNENGSLSYDTWRYITDVAGVRELFDIALERDKWARDNEYRIVPNLMYDVAFGGGATQRPIYDAARPQIGAADYEARYQATVRGVVNNLLFGGSNEVEYFTVDSLAVDAVSRIKYTAAQTFIYHWQNNPYHFMMFIGIDGIKTPSTVYSVKNDIHQMLRCTAAVEIDNGNTVLFIHPRETQAYSRYLATISNVGTPTQSTFAAAAQQLLDDYLASDTHTVAEMCVFLSRVQVLVLVSTKIVDGNDADLLPIFSQLKQIYVETSTYIDKLLEYIATTLDTINESTILR